MKKLTVLICVSALFCLPAFCTVGESPAFSFLSVEEAAEVPTLLRSDPIYYSSDLAAGTPTSVKIEVQDKDDPTYSETLFYDNSGTAVKGNYYWNYPDTLQSAHTYLLTETVVGSTETKIFSHDIKVEPEPFGFLLLGIAGLLFLRKRAKSLAAVIIAMATLTTFSAKADCTVTVSARQFYPLSRMVIIDYTLGSEAASNFTVDFSCSSDDWETSYKLSDYGTLSGEGADGAVSGTGTHTAYWTPGSTFDTLNTDNMKVRVTAEEVPPTYMVVDLKNNCAITYLDDVPTGGWTDTYKTDKMVLRYVPAGEFFMGTPNDAVEPHRDSQGTDLTRHKVTLTKAFYVGVFEVTQKQYYLITNADPSANKGDNRPLENLNFNGVTASGGFFDILNARTGRTFGLPTEAQWEYACRAGTNTDLNDGEDLTNGTTDSKMAEVGRYSDNTNDKKGGYPSYDQHTVVGLYTPNAWGLYDMHGNVHEYCRDFITPYTGTESVTDQVGLTDYSWVTTRGGSYGTGAMQCRSAARKFVTKSSSSSKNLHGFRVFLVLE